MRCCLCVAPLLFSLILFVQRCSFSSGQASLRCDSVTFTGRRPPHAPKSLIVSLLITHSPISLPPSASSDSPPRPTLRPLQLLSLLLHFFLPSPRQTGGTDAPSERQQSSDGETSDVPSLGRPRVSVQSAEMRARADALWERTRGKSVSFHTEKMNTAGCRLRFLC